MDINQEISAVKNDKGQAIDLVTTKRSAKTSIVVKDKETVVIGGLIQDTEDENVQKVPFLGDIPGLGWLFKTKTKTRKKTNLMILLTPHIVKDAADLSAVSDDQRAKFGESANNREPVNVPEGDFRQMSDLPVAGRAGGHCGKLGITFQAEMRHDEVDSALLARVPLTFARANTILPLRESGRCYPGGHFRRGRPAAAG